MRWNRRVSNQKRSRGMRRKRLGLSASLAGLLVATALLVSGCGAAGASAAVGESETAKEAGALPGIFVDTEKAEAVSIYYGSICYSYFSEDKEDIRKAADLFTGFTLEEVPNGQLDPATTYQIYFSADTEQIAAINVDKNGMFYLPEEKKFYKVKAGAFHFDQLDQIYKNSMNADGVDENQCLIK